METLVSISHQLGRLTIGWLDFLVVILILLGLHLGNRTGASKQVVSFAIWMAVLLVAAVGYRFLAPVFVRFLGVSPKFGAAFAYGFIATWVAVVLTLVSRQYVDKIEATTAFGRAEYVIGPVACMVRNVAILVVVIGSIHGIQVYPDYEKASRAEQMKVYGMILYPTSGIIRETVFGGSMTGRIAHNHLEFLMAKPPGSPAPATGFASLP